MILMFAILFGIYFLVMILILIGVGKVPIFSAENNLPTTRFSIIIPFRDEQENLPSLLKTIESLHYPSEMFEIIFINDQSTDSSEEIIKNRIKESHKKIIVLQNYHFSGSPKKDAIELGIKNSNYEWILTTDADWNTTFIQWCQHGVY